jgi:uncharacterized protein (TIGR03086 family)
LEASVEDIDVLEGVLDKLEGVVAGVEPEQLRDSTPLPGFDVQGLIDHILALMGQFAAGAQGTDHVVPAPADPVKAVRAASDRILEGWRLYGTDRDVSVTGNGPGMPGAAVLGMTIMEYIAHGCDLAMATRQPIPFTDQEFAVALERGEATLKDEYRGDSFGPRLEVADDAPVRDRFLAFMGRNAPAS